MRMTTNVDPTDTLLLSSDKFFVWFCFGLITNMEKQDTTKSETKRANRIGRIIMKIIRLFCPKKSKPV